MVAKGKIVWISGPAVKADGMSEVKMAETVSVGEDKLVGEVIKVTGDVAFVQVYESTSGLHPGEPVTGTGMPLSVTLGPGIMSQIYDGLQRPLPELAAASGPYIRRGVNAFPLSKTAKWHFVPKVKVGDQVEAGTILGTIAETSTVEHRVMAPPDTKGGSLKSIEPEGDYDIEHEIAVVENGVQTPLKLYHYWPVRRPRPYKLRLEPEIPLITGQRVIDTFFPLAKGGAAAIPGGFGTGKCVTAGTPVFFADGTSLPIEEVFERASAGAAPLPPSEVALRVDGVSVLSFDGSKITPKAVSHVFRGTTDSLLRVTTKSGRSVTVTPAHKLFKFNPEGFFEECPAGALSVGDYVAFPRKLPVAASYQDVPDDIVPGRVADEAGLRAMRATIRSVEEKLGSRRTLAKELDVSYNVLTEYASGRNRPTISFMQRLYAFAGLEKPRAGALTVGGRGAKVLLPLTLDEEMAELLGLLCSDGMIAGRQIRFFNNDTLLLDRFSDLATRLFGVRCRRVRFKTVDGVAVNSQGLIRLLRAMGYPQSRKSRNVRIPSLVLKSPDSVVASFVRGYYLGDGSFSDGTLEVGSESKGLISDMTYALSRLGVLYSLMQGERKGRRLIVSSLKELRRFVASVFGTEAFDTLPKVAELKGYLLHTSASQTRDLVPLSPEVIRAAFSGSDLKNYLTGSERLGYGRFEQLIARKEGLLSGEASVRLTSLMQALEWVYIDQLASVEVLPGEQTVYDLTVPDTHNFVGGMYPSLLHNTVTSHQIASWADTKVVVYVGCGERGNEMTEVLKEFPELIDPYSGKPLMQRTVLVANTSNMPVAAREASIYTGATLAEFYRDMGYDVVMLADSTSRWAEALREISGRLEEMPAEEGYPSYLASRLAEFYERAGRVTTLGTPSRTGSISLVGAVSPSGGDFTEPVTTHTMRFIRTFWALDTKLAYSRHYPAINWMTSYSGFLDKVAPWWKANVDKDWYDLRLEAYQILQREDTLKEIVRLLGPEVLPDEEKIILDVARVIKVGFLQQTAYDPIDSYTNPKRQVALLRLIVTFYKDAGAALKSGVPLQSIRGLAVISKIMRARFEIKDDELFKIDELTNEMTGAFKALQPQGVVQVAA